MVEFLTDFGDSSVVLPLAVVVLIYLLAIGWHRVALKWGGAVVGCGALVVGLKLGFLACGSPLLASLRSPSGHAAMSALVYGMLAGLVASRCRRDWVALPYAVSHLLIMAITLSRIEIKAHSPLEVMVGLGVGATFATLFNLGLPSEPPKGLTVRWLLVLVLVVLMATHGFRLPVGEPIQSLALDMQRLVCP